MNRRVTSAAALVALAIVAAWVIGKLLSDRTHVTQYVSWIPAWGCLIVVIPFALAAMLGSTRARAAAITSILLPATWLLLIEWRVLGYVTRGDHAARPGELLVLHWNASPTPSELSWLRKLEAIPWHERPDLVCLSNPWYGSAWDDVPAAADVPSVLRSGRFAIYARHTTRVLARTTLGIPAKSRDRERVDAGEAVLLECRAPSRTIHVLLIDLPADPWLHRAGFVAPARAALDKLSEGRTEGLPDPDLILGDFNTPRGAASIGRLFPGYAHAFDQGGAGFASTWPMPTPLQHIDHALLAGNERARRYDVLPMPEASHAAQRIILAAPAR